MTLYLIGLGLNEESITLEGLNAIKKCNKLYLETYTTQPFPIKKLEKLFNKKITLANRNLIESNLTHILKKAKNNNLAILIPGDVFSATTHITIYNTSKKLKIKTEVINNASILTAIGITGLDLYKFGRITTIPINNKNITSPIEIIKSNLKNNLHSLILLDINLTIKEALEFLIKNNLKEKAVGCENLGNKNFKIIYSTLDNLKKANFKNKMQCLIIPSKKLHFTELESLQKWQEQ